MGLRKIILVTVLCALVMLAVLLAVRASYGGTTLLVHAGAGIRPALDELGKMFEKKTAVKVEYNYKGSGCLLPDVCASQKGDVYIPGELYYMQQAVERKFVASYRVVANLTTVLVVQPGNPKRIEGVRDLARPGVRLGIGDAEAVAIGRAARQVLVKAGVWERVQKNVAMGAQNVTELSNAVKLGHIDAAIVWDATAALYTAREMVTIPIPERYRVVSPVPAGALKFSRHLAQAGQFVAFLAGGEAAKVFRKHGFTVAVPASATKGKGRPAKGEGA